MSNQLIEVQRYEIYLGLQRKWSKSRIAREIEVSWQSQLANAKLVNHFIKLLFGVENLSF